MKRVLINDCCSRNLNIYNKTKEYKQIVIHVLKLCLKNNCLPMYFNLFAYIYTEGVNIINTTRIFKDHRVKIVPFYYKMCSGCSIHLFKIVFIFVYTIFSQMLIIYKHNIVLRTHGNTLYFPSLFQNRYCLFHMIRVMIFVYSIFMSFVQKIIIFP